ncbi:MAG: ABC transporter ATP-binding protein [Clostridioides sp.]|jgi:putative ABC transport system ATP-binding protein|nr:ABC transporter ATP-binding protein [Clostridioides sp.]
MIEAKNIEFSYGKKKVLRNISVEFDKGKMYAILGKSGSGKTTLLSILSGIEDIQQGQIIIEGRLINAKSAVDYRKHIGIIFQSYNLINYMNSIQNVIMALDIVKYKGNRKKQAIKHLEQLGILKEDMTKPCSQLSGGQQQRVAIARALACDSCIIFADEPTGNLDSVSANHIIEILQEFAVKRGKCVICVTHDESLANKANEIIHLKDGKIITNTN